MGITRIFVKNKISHQRKHKIGVFRNVLFTTKATISPDNIVFTPTPSKPCATKLGQKGGEEKEWRCVALECQIFK